MLLALPHNNISIHRQFNFFDGNLSIPTEATHPTTKHWDPNRSEPHRPDIVYIFVRITYLAHRSSLGLSHPIAVLLLTVTVPAVFSFALDFDLHIGHNAD